MSDGDEADTHGEVGQPAEEPPVVLAVDDEPSVRESYTLSLEELGYEVRTAANVERALAALDRDIDIALLDRRMPDGSGDAVLEEIRARNLDCRVALVTAVDPDFDIVEIDCDDYLVKPVDREELVETIERLTMLEAQNETQRKLSNLRVKRNVLEVEKHPEALADSEQFQDLQRRIEELEAVLDDLQEQIDDQLGFPQ